MGLLNFLLDVVNRPPAKVALPPSTPITSRSTSTEPFCDLPIVGESRYQDALSAICGGHSRDGHQLHTRARLVREPANSHDPNAVRVDIDGRTVGYLNREHAAKYAERLQADGRDGEEVEVRAYINGGWRTNQHDAGSFGVRLEKPWPLKRRTKKA